MDIEKIMLEVQVEFGSGGLTEGLGGDFTREVVKRAITIEREECAEVCDDLHDQWRWDNEPDSESGPRSCAAAIRERV
jgi:hypothetical protein